MGHHLVPEYPVGTRHNGCLSCQSPKRGSWEQLVMLDTWVDEIIDLDGNTYDAKRAVLCQTCITDMAHLVGII